MKGTVAIPDETPGPALGRAGAGGEKDLEPKIAALIPARMASQRFPGKILFQFRGIPMIEHVRRRAQLCPGISHVVVATCDAEIADAVAGYGGRVIMTSNAHRTGTERIAEAIHQVDCTHVVLLQGDEPLILPDDLARLADAVNNRPQVKAWNATGPIEVDEDLDNPSVVKCVISRSGRILLCSRRSPSISDASLQRRFIRKILGLIAFERDFLIESAALPETPYESAESIEQSRILEYDFALYSVELPVSYASVNVPSDTDLIEQCLENDGIQSRVLSEIMRSREHSGGGNMPC